MHMVRYVSRGCQGTQKGVVRWRSKQRMDSEGMASLESQLRGTWQGSVQKQGGKVHMAHFGIMDCTGALQLENKAWALERCLSR